MGSMGDGKDANASPNSRSNVFQNSSQSGASNVNSCSRPSLPKLTAGEHAEESAEHADTVGGNQTRLPNRNRQLQVYLPRTPSSPSTFSGPWHGRSGDSSSSSSSSPASNKSSPTSPPVAPVDQLQPGSISRLSGSPTKEPEESTLTRRHTFPKCALQEVANALNKKQHENEHHDSSSDTVTSSVASCLEEAVTLQQPEMVSRYLELGSNPDGEMDSKVSPLILAASAGNEKIVRMLLAAGANIDYEDRNKGTALHHAAAGGHRGVLKLLLVAGANMFHKTEDGHLAVQLTNDSRICHLLTCRMRSTSNEGLETPKTPGDVPSSTKENTVHQKSPTVPVKHTSIFQIPPLPNNENGFVETTIQRLSPRCESPKNIQRMMGQKLERIKELEAKKQSKADKEADIESSGSLEPIENANTGRPRRRSVQFVQEAKNADEVKESNKVEAQIERVEEASTSKGASEKLFRKREAGTFKWTKGELLGEGAYGKVFSGLNQSTGELMAVKQLKIDPGENQEKAFYLAALEREINLYKKLRHKHIVGYINMEQDAATDSLYIFLEYVSGGSIQSMLERFGRFSEPLVRVYTRQLLLGLQYLHENKIVHRDIKGGNVLVDAIGIVKLADFGASKAFHDPTVTNECKSIRGSVFWMAPEVIKGDGYGRRADIWSVGCTVIEMLTATHPWPDIDNTWSAIFHIAKASSGPPIPEHTSGCVKDFMHQCFQLDPRLRPTAAQLLEHPFVAVDSDGGSLSNSQ